MKTVSLKSLNTEEKAAVLDRMLSCHPELMEEAVKAAEETLSGVSAEEIAARLLAELTDLGFDELHGRAGNKSFGYVGPEEAAWELFQEIVQPYLDDLKRRLEHSPENGALAVCQGIILGLYRFENDEPTDLLEYAQEFPGEAAGMAIEMLADANKQNKGQSLRISDEFLTKVKEWASMIRRIENEKRYAAKSK